MKMIKHPDPDGTFSLLDEKGNTVARGLPEQDADARIAAEAVSDAAEEVARPAKVPAGRKSAAKPGGR